jgi:hypothetical protein
MAVQPGEAFRPGCGVACRGRGIALLLFGVLLGCAGGEPPQPAVLPAEQVRVGLDAPGLEYADEESIVVRDARRGVVLRRTKLSGGGAFAVIDDIEVERGNVAFAGNLSTDLPGRYLNEGTEIVQGERGRTGTAGEAIMMSTFLVPADRLSCIGMERFADPPPSTATVAAQYRRQVIAFYCADRDSMFSLREAEQIAAGLRLR